MDDRPPEAHFEPPPSPPQDAPPPWLQPLPGASHLEAYPEVRAAAYDPGSFSSTSMLPLKGHPSIAFSAPPISSDPPHHRRTRLAVASLFARPLIDRLSPEITAVAKDLVTGLLDRPALDASTDYAGPLAARAFALFLGTPLEDAAQLQALARRVSRGSVESLPDYVAAMTEIGSYLERAIDLGPRPGRALHALLAYQHDGHRPSRRLVVDMARLLVIAGSDSTAAVLGGAIGHLGERHDERRRLTSNPGLLPIAIEEFLRLYGPVAPARVLMADTRIGEEIKKAGEHVVLSFPLANRDPEMFSRPHALDLARRKNAHMAFGAGIHLCAGAYFARLQLSLGLSAWLGGFPEYRLTGPAAWSSGVIRGLDALPVQPLA